MWWWKKWPKHATPREDIPSETLEYLAAFVKAGLSATSAWQEIPGNLDSESPLRAIQEALRHSGTLADAIERATLHAAPRVAHARCHMERRERFRITSCPKPRGAFHLDDGS